MHVHPFTFDPLDGTLYRPLIIRRLSSTRGRKPHMVARCDCGRQWIVRHRHRGPFVCRHCRRRKSQWAS